MKSKKYFLINIALCLCSFILAICIAEFAARQLNAEWSQTYYKIWFGHIGPQVYYSPNPNIILNSIPLKLDEGNCFPTDPNGLLPIKEINPYDGQCWYCVTYDVKQRRNGYNPERKRQIALVGDSFTFGDVLIEESTLGYLLNQKYPKINFQNWGKRGANIDDIADKCKEISKSVSKVDEVVYFYNLNDVKMSKFVASQQKHINRFASDAVRHKILPSNPFDKLCSKSALLSITRALWVKNKGSFLTIQNYKEMYLSESNHYHFLSTMDEIKSIKDLLEKEGISFRMIIYPVIYKDMFGCYPFESIHTAIINECNKRGIICLDGYVPFKDYYSLKRFAANPHDYHPNGLSNQKIVNYIWESNFITDKP